MEIKIVIVDGNLPNGVEPCDYARRVEGAVRDAYPEAGVDVELRRNVSGCGGGVWIDGDSVCYDAARIQMIMDDCCGL